MPLEFHSPDLHATRSLKRLLAVFGIILVATLGVAVYKTNHQSEPEENTSASHIKKVRSTSPGTTNYRITDLGVAFDLPSNVSDLTHHYIALEGDQAVNSVEFSSKRLETAGCSVTSAPLGYLTYDNDKGGVVVAHARGSDLYYLPPSGKCQADTSLQNWQDLREALKTLVTD